jgi:outer membrane protein OmpA-like peptidoglycan-associated protein
MRTLTSITSLLLLAGCASLNPMNYFKTDAGNEGPGPASANSGLQVQGARMTDDRILGDRQTLESLQQRLRKLSESGLPQNSYPMAKAQCWLDTAKTQYHENDRTGYIEESLTESARIVRALEADKNARTGRDTTLVARSTRLRDDLWQQLGALKANDAAMACYGQTVACAEVRLVRAGHAEQQTGWRAATPHIQMVEDAIRTADAQAAQCAPAALVARAAGAPGAVGAPSAAAGAAPAERVVVQTVNRETFIILADTLFRFDKAGREDMLPGGLERLNTVASRLKSYQSIQTLTIVGHTDRLGSDEYNDPLSNNRAATVRAYLESLGVKAQKLESVGKGRREPITRDCSDKLGREQLIQCLQSDRRVTIEVTGTVR